MRDDVKRVFPIGTEVSAAAANGGKWHLNAEHDGETYDGFANELDVEILDVLATVNEGK